jgi:hypothetical protein
MYASLLPHDALAATASHMFRQYAGTWVCVHRLYINVVFAWKTARWEISISP